MTRINSSIPVDHLTDEHLLAEHRDIKRLPYCLKRAISSGSIKNLQSKFCLGKGHILFFLNKMGFIFNRYKSIHNECIKRGFSVTDYSDNFLGIDKVYCNDYICTDEENNILKFRIIDRIKNGKSDVYHYYGNVISKERACSLL